MANDKFLNFGKYKIIIIKAVINQNLSYMLHHNVLLDNNTTFKEYYDKVKDHINNNYSNNSTYPTEEIPYFEILVWNVDEYRNKHIKITKSTLSPYKLKKLNINYGLLKSKQHLFKNKLNIREYHNNSSSYIKPIKDIIPILPNEIAAMDIETMEFNGKQIPVAISLVSGYDKQLFIIKCPEQLDVNSIKLAVDELWSNYFTYIIKNNNIKFIFLHNLGSFDGYFNYKYLSNLFEPNTISTIIDHHNEFIKMTLKLKNIETIWLDSKIIFDVELDKLCEVFGVEGKISKYNPKFNILDLFYNDYLLNEFKIYALQDSVALLKALLKAQEIYLRDFNIDITSIVSTSSLSLKIFRTKFLKVDIPILKGSIDNFIRKGYFGGHTDYYKGYGENIHYYDVNSLYPYSMMKPMPFKLIKHHKTLNIDLNINTNLFGFFEAECYIPNNNRPMLPYKHEGKTIYPYGSWLGVYFTEEMKSLLDYGYKFKLIRGYEFSKIHLFNDYVEYFYNKKKTSKGASRFIAKMHLNQLYGIFGRKQEIVESINVYNVDIEKYLLSRVVKTIIEINNDKSCMLLQANLDNDTLSKLNLELDMSLSNGFNIGVKSNVGLAAAVTAYSRIHMLPFKISGEVLYTDTDSIFTSKKLDDSLTGKGLGLMKDELDGNVIKEAYFLGIKQYGYYYLDSNNNRIDKSVFAGVPRNSITFNEIKSIFNGNKINKKIPLRFYKSFKDLSIKIKSDLEMVLIKGNDKKLVNNDYIPITICKLTHDNLTLFNKLKNKIIKLFKLFKIKI